MATLIERLQQRLTLKYAGNCKCGNCQLVEDCDIRATITELERLSGEVARLQQELEVARRDEDTALDLLATLFHAIEYGVPCYENPDETDGYLGAAVHLDDDTFTRCVDLLNERRPKTIDAIDAAREG